MGYEGAVASVGVHGMSGQRMEMEYCSGESEKNHYVEEIRPHRPKYCFCQLSSASAGGRGYSRKLTEAGGCNMPPYLLSASYGGLGN